MYVIYEQEVDSERDARLETMINAVIIHGVEACTVGCD
jgi:hypothetical protein